MIVRAVFLFLVVFGLIFALCWTIFRTRFFSKRRVAEITKTGSILFPSIIVAASIVGFIIAAERF